MGSKAMVRQSSRPGLVFDGRFKSGAAQTTRNRAQGKAARIIPI